MWQGAACVMREGVLYVCRGARWYVLVPHRTVLSCTLNSKDWPAKRRWTIDPH